MKNSNIRPIGRKGNEKLDRIKDLMKITPIKEGVNRSTEVITKLGPNGKAYAIIKENSDYYIKVSEKTSGLVMEDFKYIGGLMNKKNEAYSSYSEATKQLNMKFINLAESNEDKVFNILRNDNLLNEGNDINGGDAKVDKKTSGDNVADGDNIGEDDFEKATADGTKDGDTGTHAEKYVMEDVELTEDESHIDEMLNPDEEAEAEAVEEYTEEVNESKGISISKAMNEMDSIIESVYGTKQEKINSYLSTLSESDLKMLTDTLKKKV